MNERIITIPAEQQRDMLDIIFADRNRTYGAYTLRREYNSTLGRALILGVLLIGLSLLLPRMLGAVAGILPVSEKEDSDITITDVNLPVPEEVPPPPPSITPPPPAKQMTRFVLPVIVDNPPEQDPPVIDDLLMDKGAIGKVNQVGITDPEPVIEPQDPGFGVIETPPAPPEDNSIHTPVDIQKMPSFPGGEQELMKFLAATVKYPAREREMGIEGTVAVSFVIGKDGHISQIEVLRTPPGGKALGEEAIRAIESMPRWTPGEANGNLVKVRFTLPVRFRLQ